MKISRASAVGSFILDLRQLFALPRRNKLLRPLCRLGRQWRFRIDTVISINIVRPSFDRGGKSALQVQWQIGIVAPQRNANDRQAILQADRPYISLPAIPSP